MHDKMGIRDAGVDLFDALYGENVAGGGTGKLIRTVTCPNGNGQGVHPSLLDEISRLLRIGQ